MRVAALILGLLGGFFALWIGLFGYALGGIAGAGGAANTGIFQALSMFLPIAALVGGGLAIAKPLPAGILLLVSAAGMLLIFGFNFFTAIAIVLSALGGVLALLTQTNSAAAGRAD